MASARDADPRAADAWLEAHFGFALRQLPVAAAIFDPEGNVRLANAQAARLDHGGIASATGPSALGTRRIDSPHGPFFLRVYGVQAEAAAMPEPGASPPADPAPELLRTNAALLRQIAERQATEAQLLATKEALERTNRELLAQSRLDPLTGVHNRRHLDECLEHEWRRASRTRKPLSVLLLDVDRFKELNDAYGHPAGDRCLQGIARVLRDNVHRPADVVARFGGEEFLVLLPETGRDGAITVAENLRAAIAAAGIPHPRGTATVSIGVCCRTLRFLGDPAAFLQLADEALYRAKAAGRNCVRAASKKAARAPDGETPPAAAGEAEATAP